MIRKATHQDCPSIAALLLKSFKEFEALYTEAAFAATVLDPQKVLNRMKEGPIWVVEADSKVIGSVSLFLKNQEAYIRGMAVDPSYRGKKIGFHLLMQAENYAKEKKCKALYLSTTPFLDKAIVLYEGFGFIKTKGGPHDLFGTPLITLCKPLMDI